LPPSTRQGVRVSRQQEAQRVWQRQHPLPQWSLGQHLIGQKYRSLGHAPRNAGWTEAALLTAERHQLFGIAMLAAHAQETFLQPAALEIGVELLLRVIRQRPIGAGRAQLGMPDSAAPPA